MRAFLFCKKETFAKEKINRKTLGKRKSIMKIIWERKMQHNEFLLVIGFVSLILVSGCLSNGVNNEVVKELDIKWDITPTTQVYPGDGINLCLDMTYSGREDFEGEIQLFDNVDYTQFSGLPSDAVVMSFNSGQFITGRTGLLEAKICPYDEIKYNDKFMSTSILYTANVKIAKNKQIDSDKFCVPSGVDDKCPFRNTVGFPGNVFGPAVVEITREGVVYVNIPMKEQCEIIGKDGVHAAAGKQIEFTQNDIKIALKQGKDELNCRVEELENNKKGKTIICKGDIGLNGYDEQIEIEASYGCLYEMSKTIDFKEQPYAAGEGFRKQGVEE